MLFNSFEFLIFLPIVFCLYWVLNKNLKVQNLMVVAASYVFYGMWDVRFLALIFLTSVTSFLSGLIIDRNSSRRIRAGALWGNVIINIGILIYYKYFNFFAENFKLLLSQFGYQADWVTLDILLPVGISFYTFQAISYTIDVYRRDIKANKDIVAFLAFVSFFPQLVAGPIERAGNLLPQFLKARHFDYAQAVDGLRMMLWGFFKKLVIADNCAYIVNSIYSDYESANPMLLIAGGIFFAFQIYGDFSGYSDIAIGCGRLFGIKLNRNFNRPYFSTDIREFWQRWHISLNTFFRDYIYIPLGGNRVSTPRKLLNVMIVFLLSGLWHGANWTFICWGLYLGILFIPYTLLSKKKSRDRQAPAGIAEALKTAFNTAVTFCLIVISWIIFRSDTMTDAMKYFARIFSSDITAAPNYGMLGIGNILFFSSIFFIVCLLSAEWVQRNRSHTLDLEGVGTAASRWGIYLTLLLLISIFAGSQSVFIYFQF